MNQNISGNMTRSKFYVCPVCGNIIHTMGEAEMNCCGQMLVPLEAGKTDEAHEIHVEKVEDESFISIDHEMTKEHFISFVAYVTSNKIEMVKLYAEGNAETRFLIRGHGFLYIYCNQHGLMKQRV